MSDQLHSPLLCVPTTVAAFDEIVAQAGDAIAIRGKGLEELTWKRWGHEVALIRTGLVRAGLRRGETVALLLNHGPLTYTFDMAVASSGATPFSIYASCSADQVRHQLQVSNASWIITESDFETTVAEALARLGRECRVIRTDGDDEDPLGLAALRSHGANEPPASVNPEDVATLIFTSGTTGEPKAAEITHGNIMSALRSSQQIVPLDPGCRLVSYLPAAHIADRLLAYYYGLATGAVITFLASPKDLLPELPDARPHVLMCVPRTWEILKAEARRIAQMLEISRFEEVLARSLARVRALEAGRVLEPEEDAAWERDDEAVLGPVRRELGLDAVVFARSGSAPIGVETLEFFAGLGIPICEGYGLSETTGISVINRVGRSRLGTVGFAAPGLACTLSEEGELLVRGPQVMRGYRGSPEATAAAIQDGWFHTGDLASIDDDGFIRIVGRKKEIIIGSSGKNISPVQVEHAVASETDLLSSIVVLGEGRPYLVALVCLDPDALARFVPEAPIERRWCSARVEDVIATAVERGNQKLSKPEQIHAFRILPDVWVPGSDIMTATMKLRRAVIADRYRDIIEELYTR
jgi:long-subunit acyl-CoA synthetase (AMP-forming)